jgi:hypothetical protein
MKNINRVSGQAEIGDWCLLERGRDYIFGTVSKIIDNRVRAVKAGKRTVIRKPFSEGMIGGPDWLIHSAHRLSGKTFKTREDAQRRLAKYVNKRCKDATACLKRNRTRIFDGR